MFKYVGDDCEIAIRPDLDDGFRPLVLVVQDESCFAANDGRKSVWMEIVRPNSARKGKVGS